MANTKTAAKATNQDKELQKLSPYEAQVKTLVAELQDLKIQGVDDREGIKSAHAGRMALKELRVNIDKTRKELIDPALQWQRTVNAKAKELTEQIKPIEDRLKEEEDRIKEEKRRIKEAKERERMEKLRIRSTWITQHGGEWDVTEADQDPTISAHGIQFTQEELMDMEEDQWGDFQETISHNFAQAKIKQTLEQTIEQLKSKGMEMIVPAGDENITEPHLYLDYMAGTYILTISELEARVKQGTQNAPLSYVDQCLQEKRDLLERQERERQEAINNYNKELEKARAVITNQRRILLVPFEYLMTEIEKDMDPGKMEERDFDKLLKDLQERHEEERLKTMTGDPKIQVEEEPVTKRDLQEMDKAQKMAEKQMRTSPVSDDPFSGDKTTPLIIRAQELCGKINKSPFLSQNLPEARDLEKDLDQWLNT